jgi:hypothetical protein
MINEDLSYRHRLPLAGCLRAWRRGFSSRSWRRYDLGHHEPSDYLPDWAELDFGRSFPHFRSLNDKLLFPRALASLGLSHPLPLAFIQRGRLLPFEQPEEPATAGAWLAAAAARHGGLVLKPVSGMAGRGLVFLTETEARLRANGVEVTESTLGELVALLDQYLVSELVRQAAYARDIFPDATNTVRLLTLWDYRENAPFLAATAHRFGTTRSAPVDNFHGGQGGLCAGIDAATGFLTPAVTLDQDGTPRSHEQHPETGAPIAGVAVASWAETVQVVLHAAAVFPEGPYVGWDLVITDNGPCFLEANAPASVWVWQVHGGLLRDERTRAFFEGHGLVSPKRRRKSRPG